MIEKLKTKLNWFQRGTTPADNEQLKAHYVDQVKKIYLDIISEGELVHAVDLENEIEGLKKLSGDAFRDKSAELLHFITTD